MSRCLFLFLVLWVCLLYGEEKVLRDAEVDRLWGAGEYAEAEELYNSLLHTPLEGWEKARIYYNLGSLYLAQNRAIDALEWFSAIPPHNLSLPPFAARLYVNQGAAWMGRGADEQLPIPYFATRMAIADLYAAQHSLRRGEKLHADPLIQNWLKKAESSSMQLRQEQREEWRQQASTVQLTWLLERGVRQIRERIEKIEGDFSPYRSYFYEQLLSLEELSPTLETYKELKSSFALLPPKEIVDRLETLEKQLHLSAQISKKEERFLSHEMLMMSENRTSEEVFFSLLDEEEEAANSAESSSLSPRELLYSLLSRAVRLEQMEQVVQLLPPDPSHEDSLKRIRESILKRGEHFIPIVLEEQKRLFEGSAASPSSCQQFPWQMVIPFFDQGWKWAQTPGETRKVIDYWAKALYQLDHTSPASSPSASHQLSETLRVTQEMYVQDQKSSPQEKGELHSW